MTVMERVQANAEQLIEQYDSANRLLNDAMSESIPWAMALATQKKTPGLPQLERLATQIIAILLASEKVKE